MLVIDANTETNALREATALRIPTIALIDSDGDPQLVDIPIPGNDDSLRSIEVVIVDLMSAVNEGMQGRRAAEAAEQKKAEEEAEAAAAQEENRQRSSRSAFKAEEPEPVVETESSTATAVADKEPPTPSDTEKS